MAYWMCECGHSTRDHNTWWDDDNGRSGMGCDLCECGDMRVEGREAIVDEP